MKGYCGAKSPSGWFCLLSEGHEGDHMSINNAALWKETPGRPVFWKREKAEPELTREQTDEVVRSNPLLTNSEIDSKLPTPLFMGTKIDDLCGKCGQPTLVRESACRTRCMSCGNIDGGCG
jgi:hypothetical protein